MPNTELQIVEKTLTTENTEKRQLRVKRRTDNKMEIENREGTEKKRN
ncbi:MAG: hypothetical protein WC614_00130 [bacterium]